MANEKHVYSNEDDEALNPAVIQKYILKFNKAKAGLMERYTSESALWFKNLISKDVLGSGTRQQILSSLYKKKTPNQAGLVGKLYCFAYEAETPGFKEDLDLFDSFPCVFLFGQEKNKADETYVTGLNVHYLPPQQRYQLLLALMKIKTTKSLTPKTKFKAQWELIKSVAGTKIAEFAVHSYNVKRFKTKMIEIPPEAWEIVTFLNIAAWLPIHTQNKRTRTSTQKYIRQKFK